MRKLNNKFQDNEWVQKEFKRKKSIFSNFLEKCLHINENVNTKLKLMK